jgi:glycine/D-amino acid oxidase-like deaminating enzyme
MGGRSQPARGGRRLSERRVIVLGGGLAGITAALDCAEAGARVTLLEIRPRLGGAAYSFERDGLWLDNGQHVFLRCCTAYRALLARLGSTGRVSIQRRLEIPVLSLGGRRVVLRRSGLPAPLHLAGALARYPHLTVAQRVRAARAALMLARLSPQVALDRERSAGEAPARPSSEQRARGAGVESDSAGIEPGSAVIHPGAPVPGTLGEWLAQHGQDAATVAALWDLIALPTLNLPAAQGSLALGAFVLRTGLLEHNDAGDIGFHMRPLSETLGQPAERELKEAGVDVRLGVRAEGVERVERGAKGLRSREGELERPAEGLRVRASDGELDADAVICAVPHARAVALLEPLLGADTESWARLGESPIVNVHVVYDRRVCELPFAAGVGTPVQYLFDRTSAAGLSQGQYLAVSLSGAEREMGDSVERLRERYVRALGELLPRAREAVVRGFHVSREHAATFRAAPGAQALRPAARTSVQGLVLAGAWTDTGWPATLEGAVLSGHTAARKALVT